MNSIDYDYEDYIEENEDSEDSEYDNDCSNCGGAGERCHICRGTGTVRKSRVWDDPDYEPDDPSDYMD